MKKLSWYIQTTVLLLVFTVIASLIRLQCMETELNDLERELVGDYTGFQVEEYKSDVKKDSIDVPLLLQLRSDRTFVLDYKHKKIKGKWIAGDNRDWSYIELNSASVRDVGTIGKERANNDYTMSIDVFQPTNFDSRIQKLTVRATPVTN